MKKAFTLMAIDPSVKRGFTLIEVVVAVGVFGLLSITISILLISSLRGSKKAASSVLVRGEGTYALETISSQLRFAKAITTCAGNSLTATTQTGALLTFTCASANGISYLASNSAQLTSNAVTVASCNTVFSCATDLHSVSIVFTLQKVGSGLPEDSASIDFKNDITLRNN